MTTAGLLNVSYDVGIRNLSVCVWRPVADAEGHHEAHIVDWCLLPLMDAAVKTKPCSDVLCRRLFAKLDAVWEGWLERLGPDVGGRLGTVWIENQPSRLNGHMKTLQNWIYAYYQMQKHHHANVGDVVLVSAAKKLKPDGHPRVPPPDMTPCKRASGYERNKWQSVAWTLLYCTGDDALIAHINAYKKADDICDALMQSLAWWNEHKSKGNPIIRCRMDPAAVLVTHR